MYSSFTSVRSSVAPAARIFTERLPFVEHSRKTARLRPSGGSVCAWGRSWCGSVSGSAWRPRPAALIHDASICSTHIRRRGSRSGQWWAKPERQLRSWIDLKAHRGDLLPDRRCRNGISSLVGYALASKSSRAIRVGGTTGGKAGAPNALHIADRWHLILIGPRQVRQVMRRHHR